jgi:5-methyltetrahydropteroyltriglutamate--homocysteine methyltransferase
MGKSIAPTGGYAVIGRAGPYAGLAQVARDIANLKAAIEGSDVVAGLLPVVAPASVAPNRKDEFYKTQEEALFTIARSSA